MCTKRFHGSFVGGLIGDCFGAPFEVSEAGKISKSILNSYFNNHSEQEVKVASKCFTDDTSMTKSLAESLTVCKGVDVKHIAERFVRDYFIDTNRGYGNNVITVFEALKATEFKDVFKPANKQFNGLGSYGNGAAMRVSPIAMYCYSKPIQTLVSLAKQTALITHSNKLGYNGAILQCLAIHKALHLSEKSFEQNNFINYLIEKLEEVEKPSLNEYDSGNECEYVYKLEKVKKLLEDNSDSVNIEEVVSELGNGVAALKSVPTAIYSFLRARRAVDFINSENAFQRTIHLAISFGGDTDTIAAMAGNIAGAFYGIGSIPEYLQKPCEGTQEMLELADKLVSLVQVQDNVKVD